MLEKIISIAAGNKTVSVGSISETLGVSREIVLAMLENLEINGYLKKTGKAYSGSRACRTCRCVCSRKASDNTVFWEVCSSPVQ